MVKSLTARKYGYGSMPYRRTLNLTPEEKKIVLAGGLVYFEICKTHYMQTGYKIVTHWYGGFDNREPTESELEGIVENERQIELYDSKKQG